MSTFNSLSIRNLLVTALVFAPAAAMAAPPPALTTAYSADRRVETDSGDMQGRVHAMPGKERSETRVGDMSTVMILDTGARKGWMLMPAMKSYQELDLDRASKQAGALTPEQTELEAVGTETVSGLATTKYKFVMKDKSAGGFLWYTDSGIPVKMDVISKTGRDKTRMTVTLENIQIGPQDPALFQVPAGYSRMPGAGPFGAMSDGMSGLNPVRKLGGALKSVGGIFN